MSGTCLEQLAFWISKNSFTIPQISALRKIIPESLLQGMEAPKARERGTGMISRSRCALSSLRSGNKSCCALTSLRSDSRSGFALSSLRSDKFYDFQIWSKIINFCCPTSLSTKDCALFHLISILFFCAKSFVLNIN